MFGGKANIPAFPLGGTLLGVGGSDGDWGTNVAPLRKLGDEGTAMLCNVMDGGSPPGYALIPFTALDMLIATEGVTGTSELETTCASLARDPPWG